MGLGGGKLFSNYPFCEYLPMRRCLYLLFRMNVHLLHYDKAFFKGQLVKPYID